MIGNVAVEPQSTEPAVRQIEVDPLAQLLARADQTRLLKQARGSPVSLQPCGN